MYQPRRTRNAVLLWVLIILAALCWGALRLVPALGNGNVVVGGLGVLLGLFICSRPAANMIDALLFDRYLLRSASSRRSDLLWLGLNLLTLVAGWVTIVGATTLLVGRPG